MKIIIGIGHHSEVVYSILLSCENMENVKFVSYLARKTLEELPEPIKSHYLGELEDVCEGDHQFVIGFGDNKARKEIARKYPQLKYMNAIHPSAIISPNVQIGVGNVICAGVIIQTSTVIGDHNIINTNASVDHHNRIANYCHVAPNCGLCGDVQLYDGVFVGVGSSIVPRMNVKPWAFIKANSLVKASTAPIQMYEPSIDQYKTSALEAINSGWISSLGKYVPLATQKLKEVLGAQHVILTNNGTTATHCLFLALRYCYPNIGKIYVPNNVYVAAWNCALMEYDETQLEVMKIDSSTWNMCVDEDYLRSLDANSAVLVVHNVGNIINIPRLKRIRPDLIFVEDNCEGFSGQYEGHYTGTSDATLCTSISFFGNKTITTGEGGAVVVSDRDLFDYLHKTCHQGMTTRRYLHDVLGYNYRMTNVQAAFLYDQLCDFQRIVETKNNLFNTYEKLLGDLIEKGSVKLQRLESGTQRAHWMFTLRIINNLPYENLQKYMNSQGIEVRPMFYPIEKHTHLANIKRCADDLPELIQRECVMLPSSPSLTYDEQEYIIDNLRKYIEMNHI